MNISNAVKVTVYRWAGEWGPFKITIPCGECSLTMDIVKDTLQNELSGIPCELEERKWLNEWWKPLLHGAIHAPIVLVENKVIGQGSALNRGILTEKIIQAYAKKNDIRGNHIFGKHNCPHCSRAKMYLTESGIQYRYHDVVKEPRGLYEMLSRVRPFVGPKVPITLPQIWLEGQYIGGADQLAKLIGHQVEPNKDRGQCSLSPGPFGRAVNRTHDSHPT